jgi:hypothetical protein
MRQERIDLRRADNPDERVEQNYDELMMGEKVDLQL